jgi:hypothetical protein
VTQKKKYLAITYFFSLTCRIQIIKMRQFKSPTSILANEEMIYYLMSEDDALKEMKKIIKEVNEILDLPSTTMVRLLLNYFHWDKDTLTGKIKILINQIKDLFFLY